MFRNVAAKFMVFAFDATSNVPKTGDAAQITAYVSKDYGSVTVLGDTSATEMDATNAPGYYLFDAAQAETNADCLMVSGKSSTANIKIIGAPAVIYTRPTTGWLAPTTAARTLDVSAGGEAGVDWANVGSPTTSLALTGTTIAVTQKVDVDTIKTNPVVNAGTITFPTTATLASTTNITAGTITTTTNLTNAVASVTGAVGSVTGNVGGNVVGSVASVTARVTANTDQLAGVAASATNIARSTQAIVLGTVGSASTTTSIVTSSLDPAAAVADQYKGRIVTFDRATTTTNLRGQATDITANTSGGVLTVTALTDAPVSGDSFTVT